MADVIEKNLSDEFPTAVRADQKGVNILILRNIKPLKRLDKKIASYEIEHQWLNDAEDITSVQGNDFTYWQKKELDFDKNLFDQLFLF